MFLSLFKFVVLWLKLYVYYTYNAVLYEQIFHLECYTVWYYGSQNICIALATQWSNDIQVCIPKLCQREMSFYEVIYIQFSILYDSKIWVMTIYPETGMLQYIGNRHNFFSNLWVVQSVIYKRKKYIWIEGIEENQMFWNKWSIAQFAT